MILDQELPALPTEPTRCPICPHTFFFFFLKLFFSFSDFTYLFSEGCARVQAQGEGQQPGSGARVQEGGVVKRLTQAAPLRAGLAFKQD